MSAWRDGGLLAGAAAELARDRGLLLGDGLFETVLVRDGAAPRLARHLARMRASAHAIGQSCPADLDSRVAEALAALLTAEGGPPRAALRITLSAGAGRGLEAAADAAPGLTVSLAPLGDRAPGEPAPPLRAAIVDGVRIDPASPLTGHKTLSALHWVLARREARSRGADVALVRTLDGDVCEADCANVFAVVDGVVVTPGLDRGVLPGITRARVLELLASAGRPVEERALDAESLAGADEVFLTSSLDLVSPIAGIDGGGFDVPGSVTAWLAGCVESVAGRYTPSEW